MIANATYLSTIRRLRPDAVPTRDPSTLEPVPAGPVADPVADLVADVLEDLSVDARSWLDPSFVPPAPACRCWCACQQPLTIADRGPRCRSCAHGDHENRGV